MASGARPAQARSSTSPHVAALSSAKASSLTTTKPRFRSRTGCWTCRRRKVKCDERGRTAETVAYGRPLSTSDGCKRCEDSGRPCHGYGAQAPSPAILSQYPVNNQPGSGDHQSMLGPSSYYSFPPQQSPGAHKLLPGGCQGISSSPMESERTVAHLPLSPLSWARPFTQTAAEYTVNNSTSSHFSSNGTTSFSNQPGLPASFVPPHNSMMSFPSALDLRRYSVPSHPTWQANSHHHTLDSDTNSPALLETSFEFEQKTSAELSSLNEKPTILPRCSEASGDSRVSPGGVLNQSQAAHRGVPLTGSLPRQFCSDVSVSQYNSRTTPNAGENHTFHQFPYGRPHTSSGVGLGYIHENSNYHQQQRPKNYRNQLLEDLDKMRSIGEGTCTNSDSSTIMTNFSEMNRNGWSPSAHSSITNAQQHSATDFRPMTSPSEASCVPNSATATTSAQTLDLTGKRSGAPNQFHDLSSTPELPKYSEELNSVPTTAYGIFRPKEEEVILPPGSAVPLNVETDSGKCLYPAFETNSCPLSMMNAPGQEKDGYEEVLERVSRESVHLLSNPYLRGCAGSTSEEDVILKNSERKHSSSSSASSISARDGCPSPVIPIPSRRLSSVTQHCSNVSSSPSSPSDTNHLQNLFISNQYHSNLLNETRSNANQVPNNLTIHPEHWNSHYHQSNLLSNSVGNTCYHIPNHSHHLFGYNHEEQHKKIIDNDLNNNAIVECNKNLENCAFDDDDSPISTSHSHNSVVTNGSQSEFFWGLS